LNIFDLYPPEMVAPVRQALGGTPSEHVSEAHGVHWRSWSIPVRGDSGEVEHVAGLTLDISTSVNTKLELERRLATIESQQRAIHELSAPVISVWDNVLTVPLIGVMDTQRANELIERLLTAASRSGTRYAILDLTGVDALDTAIAGHLLRLLQSLRLLGVEGLVSGISPQVAQTMVGLGVELENVHTFRSLRESLRYCMKAMYVERDVG
jgi:rsbT co-antagonist protein RsbR